MRISKSLLRTGAVLAMAALIGVISTPISFAQSSTKTNSASAKITAPVDVNSADLKTLETLPGVGPATAQKIVDGRPYKTLADLQKVKGLSKSKVASLKDLVTFGPATTEVPADTGTVTKKEKKSKASTATTTPSSPSSSSPAPSASTSVGSTSGGGTGSSGAGGRLTAGQKVNINTATAAELDKIPGIGPTKAQAIVDYRTQNGSFTSIEDIQKVKGIKGGTFAKIKDYLKTSD